MQSQEMFRDCPAYMGKGNAARCGLPARVEMRYTVRSADGPLESAKIRCPRGHWFNGAIESLAVPEKPTAAAVSGGQMRRLIMGSRYADHAARKPSTETGKQMRILLISSAYNSMTQRIHAELADHGHDVAVELALSDQVMRDAVRRHDPGLVIAPMLTTAIPADIWSARPCFIVHPGPEGDRGPSSLDWAIMGGAGRWGVTVLQANAEMDAGDIWASVEFTMPGCSKSSLYRTEVADAALEAVLLAVTRFEEGSYRPEPLDYSRPGVTGQCRPPCRQEHRRIDWPTEPTSSVVAKLRAADSSPGVLDVIGDREYFLFGGYEEDGLRGDPGAIIARRDGAVCRATVDGAVWIPQLRRRRHAGGPATFKVPATLALRGLTRRRARGPGSADRAAGPAHVPGDQLPRVRRCRLSGVLLPRRGHEHRSVPSAAGCLPARPGPPGAGDRARRNTGLLRQRHPPECDRGRR